MEGSRTISSTDVKAMGQEAQRVQELLRHEHPDAFRDPEIAGLLALYQQRGKNAATLEDLAGGHRLEFAQMGATPVLGWVFKQGRSPIHVNWNLLGHDDLSPAKRTTFHELTHLLTPRDLKLDEAWRSHLKPLFEHLGLPGAAWKDSLDTPFIEGYVEGKTIERFGADPNVLYTNREVPFVHALEDLGQTLLNVSFRALFFSGQVDEFKSQLWRLCLMWSRVGQA